MLGLTGGWIANICSFYNAPAGTGFIGAIIAGILVGYFVKWVINIRFYKIIQPLVPIMIAPIAGTQFISGLFIFVIGAPIAGLMTSLTALLTSISTGNSIILGIILGGMTRFDMGGSINKVAGAMGLVGISEWAIPVAAQDPIAVIPANVIGSIVAAVMVFLLGSTNSVAHGGSIAALIGAINKPILSLTCMLAGALITTIICL